MKHYTCFCATTESLAKLSLIDSGILSDKQRYFWLSVFSLENLYGQEYKNTINELYSVLDNEKIESVLGLISRWNSSSNEDKTIILKELSS